MRIKRNDRLTSISIDEHLYKQFKLKAIEQEVTLKDLVTWAMHTYISGSLDLYNYLATPTHSEFIEGEQ